MSVLIRDCDLSSFSVLLNKADEYDFFLSLFREDEGGILGQRRVVDVAEGTKEDEEALDL